MKVVTDNHRLVCEMQMNEGWMLANPELAINSAKELVNRYPDHEYEIDRLWVVGYTFLRAYRKA